MLTCARELKQMQCRCTVEECDFEEAEKFGGVSKGGKVSPTESGYSFDPADAFSSYDLSRINDPSLRARTAKTLEELKTGAGAKKLFGNVLRKDSTPSASKIAQAPERESYNLDYKTAADENLPKASTWEALPDQKILTVKEAEAEIQKGFTLKSKDGSEVTFDKALLDHWEMDKEKTGVKNTRLPYLNNAKETVKNPKERWDQEGQRTYLQKFNNEKTGMYSVVTITNNGKVRTYYTTDPSRIEKARKGISHEVYTP